MTARIYLLRHAHSGWAMPGERDFDRTLDERGVLEAKRIGLAMSANGFQPDQILCSKAARCRETLSIIQKYLKDDCSVTAFDRLYSKGHDAYIDLIAGQNDANSVLVIGHNPMMEDTVHSLICKTPKSDHTAYVTGFPTAGLAIIDLPGRFATANEGKGKIVGFLSPRDA